MRGKQQVVPNKRILQVIRAFIMNGESSLDEELKATSLRASHRSDEKS
jgi:hypothetical protein